MSRPVLVAQFVVDPKGVPIVVYQGAYMHYRMKLMVRDAPEDAYAVTYELHETYYEPVRESRRRSDDFVEEITSYSDYQVRAILSEAGNEIRPWLQKLSEALALGHADEISPAIATALAI